MTSDVKTELENKLKAQQRSIKPYKRCGLNVGYKYGAQFQRDKTEIMEYSIPLAVFIKNAKGWGQLDYNRHPNYVYYVDMYKLLVGELANRIKNEHYAVAITCELIPRKPNATPLNIDRYVNDKDFKLYEQLKHERTQKDYIRMRLRLTANFLRTDDNGMQLVYVQEPQEEGVMHNNNRLKVKTLDTLGLFVDDLLISNQKGIEKAIKFGKFDQLSQIQRLTMNKWREMVAVLTGKNPNKVDDSNSNCISPDSVWNPCIAFPPLIDVLSIAAEGGAIECCNGDNYETLDWDNGRRVELTFPFDSKYVYRIGALSFTKEDQDTRYLPHVNPPEHFINTEKKAYVEDLAYDAHKVRGLDNNARKGIKIGLPSMRNRSSPANVAQIMQSIDELDTDELEEHMRHLAMAARVEDVDSDDEDFKNAHRKLYIEGIDLLPSIQQATDTYNQITLQKQSGHTPDFDIDEFEKQSRELYKEQVECYPQIIGNPAYGTALANKLQEYNLPMDQELSAIPLDHPFHEDPIEVPEQILNPQWKKARHTFLISRYIDFEQNIWHEDAYVPDVIKAICIWERLHVQKHKNFSMPQPHQRKNLSSFADPMVSRMDQLDTVEETFTTHSNILLCILSGLQVYFSTIFHVNIMLAGPPMGGKSRTEQKAAENLIYGTFEFLTYESAKAKTGAGPLSHNQLISFFEEVAPTMIGIGTKDGTSDSVAFLQNLLTRGELTYSVLVIGADGKRTNEKQTVKVNSVMILATNAYFSQMPRPIISRFVTITVQHDERPDRGGVTAKLGGHNTVKRLAASLAQERWKRDQCFTAKIAYFLKGMSCMLHLNTDCAKAVFAIVAEAAIKEPYCLRGFDDVRKMEQLNMITQVLTSTDGIHTVLDSAISEVKDLPWHPTHFLKILPLLFSKVEHAVFALGLIEHQFEDVIQQNVSSALVKHIFDGDNVNAAADIDMKIQPDPAHRSILSNGQQQQQQPLQTYSTAQKTHIEAHYTCVNLNRLGISSHKKNSDNSKADSSHSIINKLADILASKMVPTPQIGDIKHTLIELTQKLVQRFVAGPINSNGFNGSKEMMKLPVLEIDTLNNELKILTSYIQEHKGGRKRLLKTCIEQKLSHKYAKKNTFLYGSPMDNRPNVLDLVEVKPGKEELSLINPDYFQREICKSVIASVQQVDRSIDPIKINWDSMFSSTHRTIIDTDLDDYFTHSYNFKNSYTQSDVRDNDKLNLPSNHPHVISTRIKACYDDTLLLEYPTTSHTGAAAAGQKRKRDHNSSSMSAEIKYKFKLFARGIAKPSPAQQSVIEEEQEQDYVRMEEERTTREQEDAQWIAALDSATTTISSSSSRNRGPDFRLF